MRNVENRHAHTLIKKRAVFINLYLFNTYTSSLHPPGMHYTYIQPIRSWNDCTHTHIHTETLTWSLTHGWLFIIRQMVQLSFPPKKVSTLLLQIAYTMCVCVIRTQIICSRWINFLHSLCVVRGDRVILLSFFFDLFCMLTESWSQIHITKFMEIVFTK